MTELPDGAYVYEQDGEATTCANRGELRNAIEQHNNIDLYRRVFNDREKA